MKRLTLIWLLSLYGVAQILAQPLTFGKTTLPFDYSYVGYRMSNEAIPDAVVVVFVKWQQGDQSARIQKAIDYVSGLKPNKKTGLRGAVLLDKGTFALSQPLRVQTSGVVLRGSSRTETILLKQGTDRGAVVYLESEKSMETVGEQLAMTDAAAQCATGEEVLIVRPSTKEWIQQMGCADFGAGKDLGYWGWHPGEIDVRWTRKVVGTVDGSLAFDAPLSIAADRVKSECYVQRIKDNGWRLSNVGVENLTIDSEYDSANALDENHAWDGIYINKVKDGWVRMVNFRHLAGSAVVTQREAQRITVEDCISTDPVSEIGGYRRRTFLCMGEQCLFQRCYSEHGIHDFVAGLCAAGPNAFVQCDGYESLGYSGAVGPWCTGLLFDIVNIDGNDLKFTNLGLEGYGIGWNTAYSTAYQCTAAGIYADSVPDGSNNYVKGCWAQFNGTANYSDCNNHVKPYSLFAALLEKRLGKDVSALCRTLERKQNNASNNPTYEEAQKIVEESRKPRITMQMWIADSAQFTASVLPGKAVNVDNIKDKAVNRGQIKDKYQKAEAANAATLFAIKDGRIMFGDSLLKGGRQNTPWWNGRVRYSAMPKIADAVTRFVPGMEGQGTTTRVDSVVKHLKEAGVVVFNQNYGLWYDRRRDDHERIRRRDGDVWAPFYEQPFARSGQGKAWDGLSKYDLTKLNPWYIGRVKELAEKGAENGLLVINQHYFQHNILEAGAHWVDCPWRPTNNINGSVFPEPVPFAGDKRVWVAEYFYDIDNPTMRQLHKQYICNMLDAFADQPNIVHSIGEEYTGPYHFTKFWLQTVGEWEDRTGKHVWVALSCNKDVQDSILQDPALRKVVDIINIEQWYYTQKGIYAPEGGKNLAPRQYSRRLRPGKVTYDDVCRSVKEYREQYPDKAVIYTGGGYAEMGQAVLDAGGSCPAIRENVKK